MRSFFIGIILLNFGIITSMSSYQDQKKLHQSMNGLMHIEDPELEFLTQSIERKKEHVALLELEISTMKTLQDEIEAIYLREIHPLEVKLKELRHQLRYGKSKQDDMDARQKEKEAEQEEKEKAKRKENKQKKKSDTPFDEKKAKVLFRSLAKKFHPDTIHDETLKIQYESTMAIINTAYQNHDMDTLEKMMQENLPPEERKYGSKEEELTFLRSELAVLKKKVKRLEVRLVEIDQLPIMRFRIQMNLAKKEGRDLINELKQQLLYDIEEVEYLL